LPATPLIRIHEIYESLQGESTLAGMPCTFVRLAGCPLRCRYCDTPQALSFKSGTAFGIEEIAQEVKRRDRPLTLVTGGEPLAQKHAPELLTALADVSPLLQLETSGAFDISGLDRRVRRILDIKTPGSGEAERNRWQNLDDLHDGDEIKFIITSEADYRWMVDMMNAHGLPRANIPILASPAWGELEPSDLAAWMLRDRIEARLQLQQHKYIWGAEASGV